VRTHRTQQQQQGGAASRLVHAVLQAIADDRTLVPVRRLGTAGPAAT
jgi:hypothetical protein